MISPLDTMAFEFFRLFAQYEYALKAMGFGRAGGGNLEAQADWDRFANEIGVLVMDVSDAPVVEARQYLFELPPKRQIWRDNTVQWEEVPSAERTPQMLFSHIRRVRNNLYHGGKFNTRWIEPDRSEQLIGKALKILNALVPLHGELFEAIRGNRA